MANSSQLKLERRLQDIESRLKNLENTGCVVVGPGHPVDKMPELNTEKEKVYKNLLENKDDIKTNDTTDKENENQSVSERPVTGGGSAPSRTEGVEQGPSPQGPGEYDKDVQRRGREVLSAKAAFRKRGSERPQH